MPDDFVLNVRQISQYPDAGSAGPGDFLLIQKGGVGGPYNRLAPLTLFQTGIVTGGFLNLAPGSGIAWNGASLVWSSGIFTFSESLQVGGDISASGLVFSQGERLAKVVDVDDAFTNLIEGGLVTFFNGRTGNVQLNEADILRAGGILQNNPRFSGTVIVPTPWDFRNDTMQAANCQWVQGVLHALLCSGSVVTSFNGRGGEVVLTADDVNAALTAPGAQPLANTPPFGDVSNRIATTAFVDEGIADLRQSIIAFINAGGGVDLSGYAPLASPQFSGIPTAPTASPGTSTGQIATTAYVQAAVTAATSGVSSFNTRTGAVVLVAGDITGAGGALIASPTFTGTPAGPTPTAGDNSTKLATTAFVHAAVAGVGGVTSFNTRTGVVTLTGADITSAGGAPVASPALTGTPTAPTATVGTSTTQVATCAFVQAAIAAIGTDVISFNGRTGAVTLQANDISAVGGALLASPTFTGTPAGPTAAPGTNTTQLATCAFVTAALAAGNVTSFNTRTGAVVLASADISAAGGALLASPNFSGTPTAPTAAPGTNSTQVATTAYVLNAIGGSVVSTFNGRSGAVALAAADVTGVGGAMLAGPAFTGVPTAPTAAASNNSTQLATTAFVQAAITAGAVSSFNSRTGAVTLQANDISAVGGALLASPIFTGTPQAPTAANNTLTNQVATCQYVSNMLGTLGGVTSFNGRAGVVTLALADITGVGGAPSASPALTGTPTAPTATAGTNTTQLATTQFVTAAIAAQPPPGITYSFQVFSTPGAASYTTPAGSTTSTVYRVRMQAGGGGGGGYATTASNYPGGGGGGEFCEGILTGLAPSTVITLGIGAGGNGGGTGGGNGTAGGATTLSVGAVSLSVNGGAFGTGVTGTAVGVSGTGGRGGTVASTGGWTLIRDLGGQAGSNSSGAFVPTGGNSGLGMGGQGYGVTATLGPSGFGAGGTTQNLGGTVAAAGQPGGVGAVIIERIAG